MNQSAPHLTLAPLQTRLRRLPPDVAAVQSLLFRSGETIATGGEPVLNWCFSPTQAALLPAVLLRVAQGELSLCLTQDGIRQSLGEREWWDYSGASRLPAWALAHAVLIEGLGSLLGEALLPHEWQEDLPQQDTPTALTLAFTVIAADGHASGGTLRLPLALAARLAAHRGWRPASQGQAWGRLPATLRIELCGCQFPPAEIQAAVVGDVLVLGRRAQCWNRLVLVTETSADLHRWNARYDKPCLSIDTAPLSHKEVTMSEQASAAGAAAVVPPNPLDGIPVILDFELGHLSVPLAELAALRPGYVFQLGTPLEEARVVIRANGVRVGHGELVAVGEVLGVQLLAIDANGLR